MTVEIVMRNSALKTSMIPQKLEWLASLSVLIWIHTACKGYQQMTIVTPSKELVEISTISTSAGCKIHTLLL